MLVSEKARRQMFASEPEPVDLDFGRGVGAVMDAGRLTDQSISTHYQTSDALRKSFDALRDYGIESLSPPGILTDSSADAYLNLLDSHKDAIAARRSAAEGPPDLRLQTGEEIRRSVRDRVGEARSLASRAGAGAQVVGGLGVGITDPINGATILATLPLGTAYASGLFARMGIEGAVNMASQAGVEALASGARERAGVEVSTLESAGNVALAGVGGAGLTALFHGAGLAARRLGMLADYRAKVKAGQIVPDRATEAAADALQDHLDTIKPGATPKAEAAQLDAVAAAVDVLTAEEPHGQASALARYAEKEAVVVNLPEAGVFYHGSGTPGLAAEALDSSRTKVDNLFGEGVYLTDSRTTAEGYAKARAKKTGTPVVYRAELGDVKLIDLDTPGDDAVRDAFVKAAAVFDEQFGAEASDIIEEALNRPKATLQDVYRAFSEEISAVSRGEQIPDYEMGEFLNESLIDPLRRAGFDGFTHVGGARTGNAPHKVAIIFDPQDLGNVGRRPQFKSFAEAPARPTTTFPRKPTPLANIAGTQDAAGITEAGIAQLRRRDAIESAVSRETEAPVTPVVDADPLDPAAKFDAPSAEEAAADAEFAALTEANPDLRASYTAADGQVVAGRATDIAAQINERRSALREVLDCMIAPEVVG